MLLEFAYPSHKRRSFLRFFLRFFSTKKASRRVSTHRTFQKRVYGNDVSWILTQAFSICEKILEMKKLDFALNFSMSHSCNIMRNANWLNKSKILLPHIYNLSQGQSDKSGRFFISDHFYVVQHWTVTLAESLS